MAAGKRARYTTSDLSPHGSREGRRSWRHERRFSPFDLTISDVGRRANEEGVTTGMSEERDDFQQTLRKISEGSEEAVWYFIETYGPHIQRVIRRRLHPQMRSKFDSADFVQMVWASFFSQPTDMQRFDRAEDLLAYLAVMAKNKVIDEWRRRSSSETCDVDRGPDTEANDLCAPSTHRVDNSTPSKIAIARERWRLLMDEPSDRKRRLVQLRLQGASYAEIAQRLGIGETTAREMVQKLVAHRS